MQIYIVVYSPIAEECDHIHGYTEKEKADEEVARLNKEYAEGPDRITRSPIAYFVSGPLDVD